MAEVASHLGIGLPHLSLILSGKVSLDAQTQGKIQIAARGIAPPREAVFWSPSQTTITTIYPAKTRISRCVFADNAVGDVHALARLDAAQSRDPLNAH
mgnify:FL=1|tara:strand:- start:2545 stop:2838 length:294 start_codon:yes stop_codon:yes gene_type:complete